MVREWVWSAAGDFHRVDQHRPDGLAAHGVGVGADRNQVLEDATQVAGDGDLVHRVHDASALDPEAGGTTRVVAGHRVHALPHQFDHEQT
eukprot:gene20323-28772_t